jgi:uncharacterized protein (AIM24 family)
MTDVGMYIECKWCHGHSAAGSSTCDRCGAPLDARDAVSDGGWRQAPQLRDLTEVRFGASSVQVDLGVVPVAELSLDPADSVFFEHHVMLWKDDTVPMSVMSTPGGARRLLGDMPFVLSVAHGPGRLAFSRDAVGGLVIIPVDPGHELELRGHALLLASGTLSYTFTKVPGLKTALMAGTGMYFDQFTAAETSGLLIVHGYGNVFERTLAPGETIQLEPGGFLYKDSSVTMQIVNVDLTPPSDGGVAGGLNAAKSVAGRGFRGLKAMRELMSDGGIVGAAGSLMGGGGTAVAGAFSSNTVLCLMHLTGPGRVGMQSMYQHKTTD